MSDHDKKDIREAKRIQRLFKKVFASDDGKKALAILSNIHQLHLPSMPVVGFDPARASYMDGQKSMLTEINDIIAGKYTHEQPQEIE